MIPTTGAPCNDYDQADLDLEALQECVEPARSAWAWLWGIVCWLAA